MGNNSSKSIGESLQYCSQLISQKKFDDAYLVVEEILNQQPNNFEAINLKISILNEKKNFNDAKIFIENLIKENTFQNLLSS